jgi:outer membrane protein assembly factor BamB
MMKSIFLLAAAVVTCPCFLPCVLAAGGDDWPQFRGPNGQGHAMVRRCPVRWSETENIVWKVPIEGLGWSSPVVADGRIWLTTAIESEPGPDDLDAALERVGMGVPGPRIAGDVRLKAVCVDLATGKLVASVPLLDVEQPVILNIMNSYATPTPVVEDGLLYADFGTMGTVCLDTRSEKIVWTRHLEIEHQVGPASSPILYGDTLILTRDGCDVQYVAALDKQSGEVVWKTDRPAMDTKSPAHRKAYSTPLVLKHDGAQQMVVPGAQWMVSYEPATGRELWRVSTGSTFSNTMRPVFAHGLVYCGTAYGGTILLAIRPDGRGDVTDTHVQWMTKRSVPKKSSVLVVGQELYMVNDSGVASCLDAKSGDVHWTERFGDAHSASPVFADGRIYFFAESGTTSVFQPSTTFAAVAENSVDGKICASPAFVANSIILRTDSHLYRIGSE